MDMTVIANRWRVLALMFALVLAGGLLTLALLEKPAQAQAETITSTDEYTFDEFLEDCTGELVELAGTQHIVAHSTLDATGALHTKYHVVTQGRGVSDSGAKYIVINTDNVEENITLPPEEVQRTITNPGMFKLIRQGSSTPADDQYVNYLLHVTVNANGEVTAVVSSFDFGCK
jgi:hypothetical protein